MLPLPVRSTPILITSLVRRGSGRDGTLKDNLQPYADAIMQVAAENTFP
jgi:hypothetical protein